MFTFGPDASNHWPYHLQNSEKVTDISKFVVFEIHTSDIICKGTCNPLNSTKVVKQLNYLGRLKSMITKSYLKYRQLIPYVN